MKQYQSLTTARLLQSVGFTYGEHMLRTKKRKLSSLHGYVMKKMLKRQQTILDTSVGVFQTPEKKFVIIKHLFFRLKNQAYRQLQHEATVLQLVSAYARAFSTKTGYTVSFPICTRVVEKRNQIYIVLEKCQGKKLVSCSPAEKKEILSAIILTLREMRLCFPPAVIAAFPKRGKLLTLPFFPLYLIVSCVKEPRDVVGLLTSLFVYAGALWKSDIRQSTLVLSHKDLSSENILVKNHAVTVLDPEVCVLDEAETDLATFPRFYAKELSHADIAEVLDTFLLTRTQRQTFIALTVFSTVQMLFLAKKHSRFYNEALDYLRNDLSYFIKRYSDTTEHISAIQQPI